MADLSTGDLALMKEDGIFGGNGGGLLLFFVIMLLMMGGGWGNRGPMPNVVTQADMTAGLNNSAMQSQLQQVALSSANNNYETAQLIQSQTNALIQQNNTNLINAIQGFNSVNLTLMNQTNVLSQQVQALSAKLDDCCCAIKTQMLQDKLAEKEAQLVAANNALSNANQSQYILGQMGRWVGWTPSGTQAAAGTT